ncbi:MAG: hypothetical protein ACT4PP_05725 [Sporichthyaceae bacterium]
MTRNLFTAGRERGGLVLLHTRAMAPGDRLEIGRDTELALGGAQIDPRVSRLAVTVRCTEVGWHIESSNRNGTLIHPWGLPAWQARPIEVCADPRVAIRVLGGPDREHWVLLEDDGGVAAPVRETSAATELGIAVRPLTPAQLQAIRLVFTDSLAWPPLASAAPRQLKQVARTLGLSVSAVQERLKAALAKAQALGLSREVELTDPEYLYVLVRAGYLPTPASLA